MKKTMQLAVFLCLAAALPAQAQMYWRVELGLSFPNDAHFKDKFETGTGLFINGTPAPTGGFGPYPGASGKLTAHELTFALRF